MKPVTNNRLSVAVDQAARALGFELENRRDRTILRTLVQEVLRIQALDAAEPDVPRPPVKTPPPFEPPDLGSWDEDAQTPVDWKRRRV